MMVSTSDGSPAANGGGHIPDQAKVRITVDLVTAARRHLAFLNSLSDSTFLHHAPTILRSIRRYGELWMPLVSDLSKGSSAAPMVLPPLDVRWVWHCHCLTPAAYRQYCVSRFGRLVDRPAIFDDENEEYASNRCRDMWAVRYPSEPFDLETNPEEQEEDEEGDGGTDFGIGSPSAGDDLFPVVTNYSTLYSSLADPFVAETVYLVSARQRYKGFLHLCRQSTHGAARMVPTSDILLMWLTHQSFPGVYARDVGGIVGAEELGRRVVGYGERVGEGEAEETRRIWEQGFDEPYERAGASFDPASSPSRVSFYWDWGDPAAAVAAESNRKYKALQPRSLVEVCVFLKGKWEEIEAKDTRNMFLRLRTVRCHREMKLDKSISGLSSLSWQRTWHLYCEFGTRGVILELHRQGVSCLGNSKLIKSLVFMWNDLLRSPFLTLTKQLNIHVKAMISVTPPVQAPFLLKCVPDRVTDDKGAMISDVILRMNNYHPQEGRWLSRTVLDHARRECFVIRIRIASGFWRRGAESPKAVKWGDRIIEVREGPWSYVASSVGTAPQKVVGTAVPKAEDPEENKATWCLSTGDVLRIQWQKGLEFQLENEDSTEPAKLVVGRKLQFQEMDIRLDNRDYKQDEEQFVTLIRFTPENPNGRATVLINWRLLAVEFLPEEDAVFVLLLCMAIVRSISDIRGEDIGHLLVRHRVKEAKTGFRDWGSVMSHSATTSPHLKPWFWNPREVLASAEMDEASYPIYRYSPADGKDELYKQGITVSK
uniref:GRPD C-terminal domain-containing protein n=1 Tax=Anthurium amnicola TaxID=1678845 RepID=A0A1D1Z4F1_9ARAE